MPAFFSATASSKPMGPAPITATSVSMAGGYCVMRNLRILVPAAKIGWFDYTRFSLEPVMPIDEQAVLTALQTVKDPELFKDIVQLGKVKELQIDGSTIRLRMDY